MGKSQASSILGLLYKKGVFSQVPFTVTSFIVIPGQEGPKWIIPLNSKYGLTTLKQWRPYSVKAYLKWQLILIAYKLGFLRYLTNIELIKFVAKEHPSLLSLKHDVPIIYIGTKNPTQKAVVQLVRQGESSPYGVIKLPLGDKAEQQIKQENLVLSLLSPALHSFAPSLLNSTLGLQSWMAGKASSRELSAQHIDVLLVLKNKKIVTFASFIDLLSEDLKGLSNDDTSLSMISVLFEQLALLDRSFDFTSVWVHGDFAPWNIKVNKKLVLIDWEDGYENGLPLQDLLHFHLIQDYLFGKKTDSLDKFFINKHVVRYLEIFNISSVMANQLTSYYLISACSHQLQSNNLEHADYLYGLLMAYKSS